MKKHLCLLILLIFTISTNAFELQVSVTNETCPGNGNLQFSVIGQEPNTIISFAVYLLPNTTTPVITTNNSNVNVQVAGNYLVVASQLINGVTTTDEANVVVLSTYINPQIGLSGQPIVCGTDGVITVNGVSGNLANYQLLSGPITSSYQSSNVFTGLPAGSYVVRAIDNCGNTDIASIILNIATLNLTIADAEIGLNAIQDCGFVDVTHTINGTIQTNYYPLTIQTTFQLPGGGTSVSNQVITSGNEFELQVPVNAQNVSLGYTIQITTACGNQIVDSNNVISAQFDVVAIDKQETCGVLEANFSISNGKPPYTINFLTSPSGFNPVLSNVDHPGPFLVDEITYSNIPTGSYTAQVTDSCGDTKTVSFIAFIEEQIVNFTSTPDGCSGFGDFCASVSNPQVTITNAILLTGPTGFTYPYNASAFISGEEFCMQNVPVGNYSVQITDECGNVVTKEITFESGIVEEPSIGQRPSCELGEAAVIIASATSEIISIEIVEAPSSFAFTLPYNVNFNIASNGNFYMNSLPAGFYKFKIITNCGFNGEKEIALTGYSITSTTINEPEEICGGFNLTFNQVSNGVFGDSFFLQKYNLSTNTWEHPITGADYNPLTDIPNSTNSLLVQNTTPNLNISGGSGQYRILKTFFTLNNGLSSSFRCLSEIGQFVFEGGPKFIDAYTFPCANNTQEVVIIAEGLEPLKYRIVEKNGAPFIVDNGTQNSFPNLSPGLYKFEFEDVCGFIRGRLVDITILSTPNITADNLCPNEDGTLEVQGISFIDYKWYKQNNPSVTLSSTNILNFPSFNPVTNSGIYVVEMTSTNSNSCINQTIQYEIKASDYTPNAGLDVNHSYCAVNQLINLDTLLSNPHDSNGVWTDSNGNVLSNTTVNLSNLGTYVYNYSVSSVLCSVIDTAVITINLDSVLVAPIITAPSAICRGTDIQISITPIAGAIYLWDGPNGFTASVHNPVITDFDTLKDGIYSLTVSATGCNYPTSQITLSSKPSPDFIIDGVTEICSGQQEELAVNPQNFNLNDVTYQWSFNGQILTNQTQSSINTNGFGTYQVEVNYNGCIVFKEIIVSEEINAFDVNLVQSCSGNTYVINVLNSQDFPNASYVWSGPNSFVSNEQNVSIPNNSTGIYNVEVTDENGCYANESISVTNIPCEISNLVTLNNDGTNDTFDLSGYEVKKLSIYNRYGKLVYEKDNYLNEWMGQNENGKLLPDSTYFYVIQYKTENSQNKTGWILLMH